MSDPLDPVFETKPKGPGGRPKKLHLDDATRKQLNGLGRLQCTVRECAHFFEVSPVTFEAFLKEPGVREAMEDGKGHGKIGLRRAQFRMAEKSPAMAIFLGKNYLGQSDKHDHQHTGAGGGPIQTVDLTGVSDDDLNRLAGILGAVTEDDAGPTGEPAESDPGGADPA